MERFNSLSHSRYDCKYHIVFVPKYSKKSLFGKIRKYLKEVFHELARQKSSEIVSGHIALDHVHMCVSIPPKYAVSEVIDLYSKPPAIRLCRNYFICYVAVLRIDIICLN